MSSPLSSSTTESDRPHRKASLAERRPLFSSSDSGRLPTLSAFADSNGAEDTVVVTSGTEQKTHAFPAVDAAGGSPVFLASSTVRKFPRDAGSVLGQSVTAMHRLSEEYRELLEEVSATLAVPLKALYPTHATASPRSTAGPVTREATLAALRTMTHAQLLEHTAKLHEAVRNAVASVGHHAAVVGDKVGSPVTADAVESPVWGQHSRNGANATVIDDPMSVTNADLQHSLSAMSMIADPVRVTNEARKSIDNDGSKMINEYLVLDELGRGSFGKVKLAFDTLQCKMVAVKVVRKPRYWQSVVATNAAAGSVVGEGGGVEQAERHFHLVALQREIAVMKKLRHKNIVSLFEVIDDPDSNKLYIVMQYIENGPIGKVSSDGCCTKHDPIELLHQASNILAGLQYLHARGIIHRDLKPENILCNADKEAFLADFGVSEFFDKTDASVVGHRGTKMFMAPELLSTGTAERGKAVDLWAVGVTLYALLAGHLPFGSTDDILDVDKNPSWDDVPSYWKPVLERLLQRNPKDRISASRARRLVKQIILERVEEEDVDDEPFGAPLSLQVPLAASANVLLDPGDLTYAITPMARPKKAASPSGSNAPFHLRPAAQDFLRPTFSEQESFKVLPQFQISQPDATYPAATAAPATRDEEGGIGSGKLGGGGSGGGGGNRATAKGRPDKATSALTQHFNLRNATVIDLSELDGPGGVVLGGGPTASRAASTARGAAAVDFAALAASAVQRAISGAGAALNGNEDARRESSRCHRRLQELLTEQRQLETQRRLVPSGLPRW